MSSVRTKTLRAGIIGLGVGEKHVAGYRAHPACAVVAVCDKASSKLSEVQAKYGIFKACSNPDQILEDPEIDIVSIASYDPDHYEQIVKAIQNEKHIFVEKPLCLYEQEAVHIRALLKSKPHLKMSTNFILRKSPRFQGIREKILNGFFGELFYAEGDYHYGRLEKITEGWRGQIDFYSVVYGGSVHLVDLLLWLSGDTVEEVFAYGNQIASRDSQFKYNDCVAALLKFKSGMIGKITADFGSARPHFHSLNIYGTQATFVNDLPNGKLFTSRDPKQAPQDVTEPYPGIEKGDLIYRFVDSIANQSSPEVSQEDVFRAMSVCFAIETSVKEKKPVRVEYI